MIAYNIYKKIRTLISTFIVCSISGNKFSSIKIASFTTYAPKGKTSIGKDFYAGEDFYLSTNKYCRLVIGDGVMFGPCVRVLGGNHSYTYTASHLRYHQQDDPNTKAIELEDGVWIGANVTILSGARISEGSIVGASSLD